MVLTTREILDTEYRALFAHMKRDFPPDERPPFFVVKGNLKRKVYHGMFFQQDGRDVGYAIITAPPDYGFGLVNFLSIFPEHRSKGYGGEFLKAIAGRWPDRVLVLEVEAPSAAKNEAELSIRRRRIGFYERAGYRVVPTKKFRLFGVNMEVMVNTEEKIGSVKEILHRLYEPAVLSAKWLRFVDIEDLPR